MSVWHTVWHITESDGRITSKHRTNDDNDDGWPDDEIVDWTIGPQPKEIALRSPFNRSHIGCSGCYVYVYLDGKELT
jgi:hypothetical protein